MSSNFDERLFGQPYPILAAKIRSDLRLSRVLSMIEGAVGVQLSIDAMAAAACMSPTDFKRSFARRAGFPPYQFIARYRTAQAVRLLLDTELTVTEVGIAAGFSDLRALHRSFRRFLGQGPTQFRKAFASAKFGLF